MSNMPNAGEVPSVAAGLKRASVSRKQDTALFCESWTSPDINQAVKENCTCPGTRAAIPHYRGSRKGMERIG